MRPLPFRPIRPIWQGTCAWTRESRPCGREFDVLRHLYAPAKLPARLSNRRTPLARARYALDTFGSGAWHLVANSGIRLSSGIPSGKPFHRFGVSMPRALTARVIPCMSTLTIRETSRALIRPGDCAGLRALTTSSPYPLTLSGCGTLSWTARRLSRAASV